MTEAEWLACDEPRPMLDFLRDKASDRRYRLFGLACCRRVWRSLLNEGSRAAVEVAERFAEGEASEEERAEAEDAARAAIVALEQGAKPIDGGLVVTSAIERKHPGQPWWKRAVDTAERAASANSPLPSRGHIGGLDSLFQPHNQAWMEGLLRELKAQAKVVRDIFGNPFRPVAFDPSCRTPDVTALAKVAYDERSLPSGELDPHCLAVLADALEEVGADGEAVAHLRGQEPHVRGCWAVDLVLGKE
jgi:hypothetical protein